MEKSWSHAGVHWQLEKKADLKPFPPMIIPCLSHNTYLSFVKNIKKKSLTVKNIRCRFIWSHTVFLWQNRIQNEEESKIVKAALKAFPPTITLSHAVLSFFCPDVICRVPVWQTRGWSGGQKLVCPKTTQRHETERARMPCGSVTIKKHIQKGRLRIVFLHDTDYWPPCCQSYWCFSDQKSDGFNLMHILESFQCLCTRDGQGGPYFRGAARGENPRGGAKKRVNRLIKKINKSVQIAIWEFWWWWWWSSSIPP